MLVYDLARQLANEIGESEEYRQLLQAKERINQNEASRAMLEGFQRQQLELQQTLLKGETVPEEKALQLEELNRILAAKPSITEYRVAELRLVRLMGDVEKIDHKLLVDMKEISQDKSLFLPAQIVGVLDGVFQVDVSSAAPGVIQQLFQQ